LGHPIHHEVSDDDDVIVLHQGRVLVPGSVFTRLEAADDPDIRAAFTWLSHGAEAATDGPMTAELAGVPQGHGVLTVTTRSASKIVWREGLRLPESA